MGFRQLVSLSPLHHKWNMCVRSICKVYAMHAESAPKIASANHTVRCPTWGASQAFSRPAKAKQCGLVFTATVTATTPEPERYTASSGWNRGDGREVGEVEVRCRNKQIHHTRTDCGPSKGQGYDDRGDGTIAGNLYKNKGYTWGTDWSRANTGSVDHHRAETPSANANSQRVSVA